MITIEVVPNRHRVRLYVNRVKVVFALSVMLQLACVIGFDLCMHNIVPGQFTGINRSTPFTEDRRPETPKAETMNKNYEPELNNNSGSTGMDSGRRLLRPLTEGGQAR